MQLPNDFWKIYDLAQAKLSADPEYCQIEKDIRAKMNRFENQEQLENLTNALLMQSTFLAFEVYQIALNQQQNNL